MKYELNYCGLCFQLTNHVEGKCRKCELRRKWCDNCCSDSTLCRLCKIAYKDTEPNMFKASTKKVDVGR